MPSNADEIAGKVGKFGANIEDDVINKLERAGEFLAGKMSDKIDSHMSPANHPFTAEQKGSSQPLVDKGEMQSQITHKMKDKTMVEVGVFGSKAYIASIHEFGKTINVTDAMRAHLHKKGLHLRYSTLTIRIPERSFIRSAYRENIDKIKKILLKAP